ncbi:hypothetical protein OOJ09_12910 [Mesorhizobium qingshengii]|uniref:Uncharacterized protein n=1 Tax=Mesorhizobium qingshengii TaxID=1165689 RepID=A0ABT4QU35_9HYPH|nr:hypothetical protein [Mesorhizobium qingshengii]MCZ8545087.1 hypothetical protein [Mesorhizobium qingshengii]
MDGGLILALLGAAGTIVAIVSAIVASHRTTSDKIQKGDDALHDRINRVRDEYVRRIDLDSHMSRIETNVKELREEGREGNREINRRLDQVLTTLQPQIVPPPPPRRRS